MEIQHRKSNDSGAFYIAEDGEVIGEMDYAIPEEGQMVIEHTIVDEDFRGQDMGYELVQHAVEYARANNIKIVPVCSFAKAVFDRKPDFSDVLL